MEPNTPFYYVQDGLYCYVKDNEVVYKCEEVAIAFDKVQGTLFKHGVPEEVLAVYNRFYKVVLLNKGPVDNLVYLRGKFDVLELNKIIVNHANLMRFYANHQAKLDSESWVAAINYLQKIAQTSKS